MQSLVIMFIVGGIIIYLANTNQLKLLYYLVICSPVLLIPIFLKIDNQETKMLAIFYTSFFSLMLIMIGLSAGMFSFQKERLMSYTIKCSDKSIWLKRTYLNKKNEERIEDVKYDWKEIDSIDFTKVNNEIDEMIINFKNDDYEIIGIDETPDIMNVYLYIVKYNKENPTNKLVNAKTYDIETDEEKEL